MTSLLRRLLIAALCLAALVLILGLADVELARHHARTSTSVTLLSSPTAARAGALPIFVEKTEPPALGEALFEPLTKQLESRGVSVRLLAHAPNANERPAVTLRLRAAPLRWNPLHATATLTARLEIFGSPGEKPTSRGTVTVTDLTNGLTSRKAYLRHLAEAAASGIADTLTESLTRGAR